MSQKQPKVSIVIPVYNAEVHLRQCLDSVVNQTLRDIEIICVDDGSTDGSATVLTEYAAKDPRIVIVSRNHKNAGAARNVGIDTATGEYLGFVDADDFCDRTLFEKGYAQASKENADLVSFCFNQYDERIGRCGASRVFPKTVCTLVRPFAPESLGDDLFAPIAAQQSAAAQTAESTILLMSMTLILSCWRFLC